MHNVAWKLGLVVALAGCAGSQPASTTTFGPASEPQALASSQPAAQASPPIPAPAAPTPFAQIETARVTSATAAAPPASAANASNSVAFATRHAYYASARFADLPGWNTDDLGGSWDAFKRSCSVLGSRAGWSDPCAASRSVDAGNAAAIREFFEAYFNAYQIRNTDRSGDGTLTGYYEPLLNGSQQYGGAFLYPIYGTPDDMLYLDARRLPDSAHGSASAARIEGRTVIPLTGVTPGDARRVYVLDLRDSVPDIRDKKIRLRLDHDRIVPYYTRAEIERGALKAPVLAYVDDPVMLYSMQVQGAGKVRMRDGTLRRFAYAEQNGQPFLPPVARTNGGGQRITVRGMDVEIDVQDEPSTGSAGNIPAQSARDAIGGVPDTRSQDDDEPVSPLLRGFKLASATPQSSGSVTPAIRPAGSGGAAGETSSGPGVSKTGDAGAGKAGALANTPVKRVFAVSDPSYVFFRLTPDSPNGPVGALGVPLSAGRSVAVDPRTTPLGAPVFVSTRADPQAPGAINRLMMAQDSGGAIRGAVRADYFYGFGQSAQTQASRTKERIQMWVLLPKGLPISARDAALKTRGGGESESSADCVVSDPQLCVDDTP